MEEEIGCTVLPCIQLELTEIKMCCVLEDEESSTFPWDCDPSLLSTAVLDHNSGNDKKVFKTEKKCLKSQTNTRPYLSATAFERDVLLLIQLGNLQSALEKASTIFNDAV